MLTSVISTPARPIQYFKAHSGAVRSIVSVAGPPLSSDLDGELYLDGEATAFISGGYEGTNKLFDLRDTGSPTILSHDRGELPGKRKTCSAKLIICVQG